MSQNRIDTLKLGYEHLYNLRDQTLLPMELCLKKVEYTEGILVGIDKMIDDIVDKIKV